MLEVLCFPWLYCPIPLLPGSSSMHVRHCIAGLNSECKPQGLTPSDGSSAIDRAAVLPSTHPPDIAAGFFRSGKTGFAMHDMVITHHNCHRPGRREKIRRMNRNNHKSKPTCSQCGSNDIVLKSRTHVGDSRNDDVIKTEMIGCAVICRYLACEACGRHVTRAEYEGFQKGG